MRIRALALAFFTVGLAASLAQAQDSPATDPAVAPAAPPAEAAPPAAAAPVEAPAAPAPAPAPPAAAPPPAPVAPAPPPPVYQAPPQAPVYQAPPQAPVYQAPPAQAPSYPPYGAPAPGTFTPYSSPLVPGGGRPTYPPPPAYQLPPPAWNAPRVAQAQPPPTYVLPPPPNGYMYMPVPLQQTPPSVALTPPDVARRDQIYAELQQTEMRLAQLKQDKISVGGPVTMLVLGFGTTVVAGLIGLGNFAQAERIQHGDYDPYYDEEELDYNEDGKINGHDSHEFRQNARLAGGIAAAGLLVGIIGAVRLSTKREERRKRGFDIRSLTHQRDNLRTQLGLSSGPGYYGVSAQGGF